MKGHRFAMRLGYALAGLRAIWAGEPSFRAQAASASVAAAGLAVVRPGAVWTALVLLAIGLVLAAEAVNTALEHLADTVHPAIAPGIKVAKDVAAAAVLIASLTAVAVGLACAYSALS